MVMGFRRTNSQTNSLNLYFKAQNMLVTELFLKSLIKLYGKRILYIQMAVLGTLKHVIL
jgi:hypothetical protein